MTNEIVLTDREKQIAEEVRKAMLAIEVRILKAMFNGGSINVHAQEQNKHNRDIITITINKGNQNEAHGHRQIK